jgi:hypothetical protein
MLYSVSQRHYFREISRIVPAGGSVYLPDDVAEKYLSSWPGLLAPMRQTTQGSPKKSVRASEPPAVPRNDEPKDEPKSEPKKPRKK